MKNKPHTHTQTDRVCAERIRQQKDIRRVGRKILRRAGTTQIKTPHTHTHTTSREKENRRIDRFGNGPCRPSPKLFDMDQRFDDNDRPVRPRDFYDYSYSSFAAARHAVYFIRSILLPAPSSSCVLTLLPSIFFFFF